jgi:predicted MPP superfamily phosphohydrolase
MKRILRVSVVILLAGLVAMAYAYFIEPHRLIINEQEIAIDGLDPAFDGLRIVLLADIHAGSHGVDHDRLRQIVETVNSLDADVIALLGDFVSTYHDRSDIRMPADEIARALEGFQAKDAVVAVLGNHDGWYGNVSIGNELRSSGIRVLENEIVLVERNGQKLRIFGMRDHLHMGSWHTFDRTMQDAVASYEQRGDLIVLQHSPDVFPVINAHKTFGDDLKLMLAGHTHGGQIWFPILGSPIIPSSFGQRYAAGHIRENGKHLFITTGIGTSILPFRFLVPPEIAVVTLRSK